MRNIEEFDIDTWDAKIASPDQERAIDAIENGQVLFLPRLAFPLEPVEKRLFADSLSDGRAKNISYRPDSGVVKGVRNDAGQGHATAAMMRRFADAARDLLLELLPAYSGHLERGKTSFRVVEIAGRSGSLPKDDTRLHVDAFPATPTGGKRIMRLFANVNPVGQGRDWRVGLDSFPAFAGRFVNRIEPPLPGSATAMRALRITRGRRTLYDHFMLQLHDRGKADDDYQRGCPQFRVSFPPGSTWLCFSDQVLHAVHAGRYMLEQTFYIPVDAQRWPERSPLRVLERLAGVAMV